MCDDLATYTFLPWARRGMATEIGELDLLGEPGAGGALDRPSFPVEIELTCQPIQEGQPEVEASVRRQVQLLGPGDVLGIRPEAIVRSEPPPGSSEFAPPELVYVEFYEEDFPWRYTPARAAERGEDPDRRYKLRPWIALWVLRPDECTLHDGPGSRPFVELATGCADAVLPLETETWAWAHVHITGHTTGSADAAARVDARPDLAVSRLVCPRRLLPETEYWAFVVPSFETGRRAGLGLDPAGVPAQQPAWFAGRMRAAGGRPRPLDFPVYHRFRFRTHRAGNFETLARRLRARAADPRLGRRAMDVRDPGYGMDAVEGPGTTELEGALMPPAMAPTPYPDSPGRRYRDALEERLDLCAGLVSASGAEASHPLHTEERAAYPPRHVDDPIVTPPVYGRWHADIDRLADGDDRGSRSWVRELNLDPRSRAVAGLGAEAVRARQEELMERAWQQVREVKQAHQRMREAALAEEIGGAVHRKHIASRGVDRVLGMTSPAHRAIAVGSDGRTARAEIAASQIPDGLLSPTFRRIARPRGRPMRRLRDTTGAADLRADLIERSNRDPAVAQRVTAAPRAHDPRGSADYAGIVADVRMAVDAFRSRPLEGGRAFQELLATELRSRTPDAEIAPAAFRRDLRAALARAVEGDEPAGVLAVEQGVAELIGAVRAVSVDPAGRHASVRLDPALFEEHYGDGLDGKSYLGVTVLRDDGAGSGRIVPTASLDDLELFQTTLEGFETDLDSCRAAEPTRTPLRDLSAFSQTVDAAVRADRAIRSRVQATLRGVEVRGDPWTGRPRPVMAHPRFRDATYEDLRRISQDHVIPNMKGLLDDSITLLRTNPRFIQAFLAGMNHELARELLWREYPTDQRGTFLDTFWATATAPGEEPQPDIHPIHEWTGRLGGHGTRDEGYLVLVIRGELLRRYPGTAVYAQPGMVDHEADDGSRRPDYGQPSLFPAFEATLEPDIALFGFALDEDEARGYRTTGNSDPRDARPGWFFVLQERPGEVRFGLDDVVGGELPELTDWQQLTWGHLTFPENAPKHIAVAVNRSRLVLPGSPEDDVPWGGNSAAMASILLQDPFLFARHAEEMLP